MESTNNKELKMIGTVKASIELIRKDWTEPEYIVLCNGIGYEMSFFYLDSDVKGKTSRSEDRFSSNIWRD